MTNNRSTASTLRALTMLSCMVAAGCPDSKTTPSAHDNASGDASVDAAHNGNKHHVLPGNGSIDQGNIVRLADGGVRHGAAGSDAGDDVPDTSKKPSAHSADHGSGDDAGTTDSGKPWSPPPGEPQVSADPGERGPWPVGVRTLMLDLGTGQHIPVDVWYPAQIGSDAGKAKVIYDFLDWLPPEAKAQLPSAEIPVAVPCNCYRDLPIDAGHGPYPISIAVHHTGAFRAASLSLMSHWASRGFVVVAADHPKLVLADVLADTSGSTCSGSGISADANHTRDIPALLGALRQPAGDFAFLADRLDVSRIAISGNGDGGPYAAAASGEAGVRLIMQWDSATAVQQHGDLAAVVYVSGVNDSIYPSIQSQFQASARGIKPALLVSVSDAGPLSMTEICNARSPLGRTGIDLSQKYMLCNINFDLVSAIFPCSPNDITQAQADLIFSYATTAALEEFLLDKDSQAAWNGFKSEWGTVQQLR